MSSFLKRVIPNFLTLGRLAAILPEFLLLASNGSYQLELSLLWFYTIASDMLDGFLSRYWNVRTKYGRVLDGGIDKLVIMFIGYALWKYRGFPGWIYLSLLLVASTMILLGATKAFRRKKIAEARWTGKIITFIWAITGWFYMMQWQEVSEPVTYFALFLTGIAALDYLGAYFLKE